MIQHGDETAGLLEIRVVGQKLKIRDGVAVEGQGRARSERSEGRPVKEDGVEAEGLQMLYQGGERHQHELRQVARIRVWAN